MMRRNEKIQKQSNSKQNRQRKSDSADISPVGHCTASPLQGPDRFFLLLIIVWFVSIPLILGLTLAGIYRVHYRQMLLDAHSEVGTIIDILLIKDKSLLLSFRPDGSGRVVVPERELSSFDWRMQKSLKVFGLTGISLLDTQGRIIYSTWLDLVGSRHPDLPPLQRVLAGQEDIRLTQKGRLLPLVDTPADRDLLVGFAPIFHSKKSKKVLGIISLNLDFDKYTRRLRIGLLQSGVVLAGILVAVSAVSFAFVRRGALQLRRAQQVLHHMAMTDALTGLLNRAEALGQAEKELERAKRHNCDQGVCRLVVMLFDVDHFKTINDQRGHLAGDQVLRQLADLLRQGLRPYDILGRYGGEEFLVVLPQASYDEGGRVAERLARCIREHPFVVEGEPVSVTVSVGYTTAARQEETMLPAIRRADQALYQAKLLGRNREVGFPCAPGSPGGFFENEKAMDDHVSGAGDMDRQADDNIGLSGDLNA
jgi:diguanylate cyclase (GGDEF)-like protein